MNPDFFKHLDQLELLAFFSGYPLLYAFVTSLFSSVLLNPQKIKIVSLLPFAYALIGTLYLAFQMKNLYPDYSFDNIRISIQPLKLVGLLSILFWLPIFSKRPILSLTHSLIFFFLLAKDLFLYVSKKEVGDGMIRNNMKVFTGSLLLSIASLITLIILSYALYFLAKTRKA